MTLASVDFPDQAEIPPHSENDCGWIMQSIKEAAHLLPSQGPITAFVHHNTLHALEELDFDTAVQRGAALFSCNPYLSEVDYRKHFDDGRIRGVDIEAVLKDEFSFAELEKEFNGTTGLDIAKKVFFQKLRDTHFDNLRWVLTDTDALHRFRLDVPSEIRKHLLDRTKQWVMRELRTTSDPSNDRIPSSFRPKLTNLLRLFSGLRIENWTNQEWESFVLHLLWNVCEYAVNSTTIAQKGDGQEEVKTRRPRDLVFAAFAEDPDELVNQMLIPFCSAFIDQGFSNWELPGRENGFFRSFIDLHSRKSFWDEPWKKRLRIKLSSLREQGSTAIDSVRNSLEEFGISSECATEFLCQTLLSLRGFAGMINQLETRSDRANRGVPKNSLVEFVAIKLLLDQYATEYVAKRSMKIKGGIREISRELNTVDRQKKSSQHSKTCQTIRLFELSQLFGWLPEELLLNRKNEETSWFLDFTNQVSGINRRRMFHLAYERKYRNATLDAVLNHNQRLNKGTKESEPVPAFQIVCCIDEREESFRRHIEEIEPECETFGAAGFFAVPMYYRGAADAHYTPLCPVVIKPDCFVREEPVYSLKKKDEARKRARRTIGTVTHQAHIGSRTFTAGWLGTALLGCLATFPLVLRVLFPRVTAKFRKLVGGFIKTPEVTRLTLHRESDAKPGSEDHSQLGFTTEEMADAVLRLLTDIGVQSFSRLFFMCGHGSASLNNPHESAHDCGACAGGRGGPNARAFAQMANDPNVRKLLAKKGFDLPDTTYFIGCYHNTCDDGLTFFDLDQLPFAHQSEFEKAAESLFQARKFDAHERSRRFESCRLDSSVDDALTHVEGRAEDLSQVRPEYGHATNALCFVGKRTWSRGLFLDRRAFLQSYDPALDDENNSVLERILQAVIPVCAGINLEYYFSYVDSEGYGCGTKLPHNITALIGVMNGAMSDLRPGLPWQMVEIHEPVRLLFLIECSREAIEEIISRNEGIKQLVSGRWVQLALVNSETNTIDVFESGKFETYSSEEINLPVAGSSLEWYRGWRDHLEFASIDQELSQSWN